jgi:hypothetical protein
MQDDGVGWLDRRSFTVGAIAAAATTFYPDRLMSERLPMIVVDQLDGLMDVPIAIELRGFAPRQAIALTATQIFPSHSRWQARATFMSDDAGDVGVARQAPILGSYDGVAAMGLIWAAERVSPPSPPIPDDWILQPSFIHLEAEGPNDQRAELTITRAGPGVARRAIRVDGLVGILFLPPGAGPHPSVLVLHGGGGGIDEYTGAMLASRGYAAFNLSYFSAAYPEVASISPSNISRMQSAGCGRNPGWATGSWPFGGHRAAANSRCCSAPPFRHQRRQRVGAEWRHVLADRPCRERRSAAAHVVDVPRQAPALPARE